MFDFLPKKYYHYFEKAQCVFIVFVLTPSYFVFMLTVVRESLVNHWKLGNSKHLAHVLCSTYIFLNVIGNMLQSIFTDSRVRNTAYCGKRYDYCDKCDIYRPKRSWHCSRCNVCILKRDHHCMMFSSCIGLLNQRYYICYLFYITIAMMYSTLYTYYFVAYKFEDYNLFIAFLKIINPALRYYLRDSFAFRDLYIVFMIMNIVLTIWCIALFVYHFKNVLKGTTAYERRSTERKTFNCQWKNNFKCVFGEKWILAILCPFTISPLPRWVYDIDEKIQ